MWCTASPPAASGQLSLIGGETAEMPGLYQPGDYDLAGFVVGIGERDALIDGSDIAVGNRIVGWPPRASTNGYSLVRKVFSRNRATRSTTTSNPSAAPWARNCCGRPASTSKACSTSCAASGSTAWCTSPAAASSTTSRASSPPAATPIQVGSWPVPPVFAYLQEKGSISAAEMYRTFNMGIGMMAIVAESSVEDLLHQLKAHGEEPFLIGEIRAARGGAGRQVVLEGID